jgi:hypothetical protein
VILDDQEPLEPEIRDAARSYHEPPPVPRDEVWARIEAHRVGRRSQKSGTPGAGGRRIRFLVWAAGIAALLALGVGIGRLSVRPGTVGAGGAPVTTTPVPVVSAPAAGTPGRDAAAYRLATAEHLGQAEAFLTLFRASVREGRQERLASTTARQLLATNRLLFDSPASTDPRLKFLLQDLELVLAQIAQLAPEGRSEDLKLITDGLEQDGMMVRLRSAVPAGTAGTYRQGAL